MCSRVPSQVPPIAAVEAAEGRSRRGLIVKQMRTPFHENLYLALYLLNQGQREFFSMASRNFDYHFE
jgi:hypothetical protein